MLPDAKTCQKSVGFYAYKEGEERPKGDFYATPPQAVHGLLSKELFGRTILEPCCGNGAISKILEAKELSYDPLSAFESNGNVILDWRYKVISRDLYDWGYGESGKDFLKEPIINVDAVVTNPPFNLSMEFTYRALECTKEKQGKVAILNRIAWLESAKRKKLFENSPLSRVWIFSKRLPRFNRYDFTGQSCTSLIGFAFFVWDWTYKGEPRLGWI